MDGQCDYCVTPSSKNWVFGFFKLCLVQDFGPVGRGDWYLDLGLTIMSRAYIGSACYEFCYCCFLAPIATGVQGGAMCVRLSVPSAASCLELRIFIFWNQIKHSSMSQVCLRSIKGLGL